MLAVARRVPRAADDRDASVGFACYVNHPFAVLDLVRFCRYPADPTVRVTLVEGYEIPARRCGVLAICPRPIPGRGNDCSTHSAGSGNDRHSSPARGILGANPIPRRQSLCPTGIPSQSEFRTVRISRGCEGGMLYVRDFPS